MYLKNACFQINTDPEFVGCHDGLFENGEYIDTSTKEGMETKHRDVTATISRISARNRPSPDFLNATEYRCLSERALDLFLKERLNLWPAFRMVPVRVCRASGKLVGKYWWPKFDRKIDFDAFDYEHSKYTVFRSKTFPNPKKPFYQNVSRWVLRADVVGSLDLFHSCLVHWYGSARLKQLVETHGLHGFVFTPVELWRSRPKSIKE